MSAVATTGFDAKTRAARRKGPTLSIATVLALSFGLLVVLAVALVLFIGVMSSGKNTVDLLNEKSMMIVDLMETGVRNHLDPAMNQAVFIERQVRDGLINLDDRDGLSGVLLGALAAAPQIEAVVFWDTGLQQTVAFSTRDGQAGIEFEDESDEATTRLLWERVQKEDGPFWGELFFHEEQDVTYVNLIQPLRRAGEVKGFLAVVVSMPELSEFITRIGDRFGSTAYILYGEDRVLAHPNLTSRHPDLNKDTPAVSLDRVGDLVLGALDTREPGDLFEQAAAAGVAVDILTVAGVEYVNFSGRLQDYGPVPWTVGAYVRTEDVDDQLERLRGSALAGLIVLVLSIIAAVVLGRMLARPIRRMAVGAAQVGALDLGAVEPLPPSPVRELRDQGEAFNRMLAGLKWFETYVPRTLVKRLMASGEAAQLVSGERELTILFTDIVGFTPLSEAMPAPEIAALLNDHFALLGGCIEAEGGTIDKFIGDALMAFWGAPDEQADHATRACRAAGAIARAVAVDNAARRAQGLAPLRMRIGVHTGPVVVGNIGAPGRINYTIVGDTVNAAQRLEVLGKELDEGADVTVLTSAETAAAADRAEIGLERVGAFEVKGKQEPLEVFRLKAGPDG